MSPILKLGYFIFSSCRHFGTEVHISAE